MAGVVARFYVAEITKASYNPGASSVVLRAVSRGPENASWAAATPAGELKMTIGNPNAAAWFEERLGKEITFSFSDAPSE